MAAAVTKKRNKGEDRGIKGEERPIKIGGTIPENWGGPGESSDEKRGEVPCKRNGGDERRVPVWLNLQNSP